MNDTATYLASLYHSFQLVSLSSICRRRRVSKFSPGHMYDVGKSGTEERELQPMDNGHQPALEEKEREALEESAIVPPPTQPRSAITTEGRW